MAPSIRRNLYSEVTSRILAELELGAAPWITVKAGLLRSDVKQVAPLNQQKERE